MPASPGWCALRAPTSRSVPSTLASFSPPRAACPWVSALRSGKPIGWSNYKRVSSHLGVPLNLHPKFFPVDVDAVAQLIIAVDTHDGAEAAMTLCGAVFSAVWAEERNLADPVVLNELLVECYLPAERAEQANSAEIQSLYASYTSQALEANVFGAPSYVLNGEIFWGQDRLDFLERALAA